MLTGEPSQPLVSFDRGQLPGLHPRAQRELGEDPRVDPVGLGQPALRAGVVPHPPGIDHDHRQLGRLQFQGQSPLIPPSGLQDDTLGADLGQEAAALADAFGLVGVMGGLAFGQEMQIEMVLADVDSHNLHEIPLPCVYELIGYNGSGDCSGS